MTSSVTAEAPSEDGGAAIDVNDLFDSIGAAMLVLDGQTTIRSANLAAGTLIGIHAPTLIGRRLFDLIDACEHTALLSAIEHLKARVRSAVDIRLPAANRGAGVRMVNGVMHRYATKGETLFFVIGHDDEPSQEALGPHASRMEIRPGGRWRYELKTRRFSWYVDADADPASTRPSFTGLAQDAGSGLFHPDEQEECKAAFRKAIETRQPFFIRHRVLRPSGSYAMFGSFGSVDCTPDGKPVALVAVAFEFSRGAESGAQIGIAEVRARELESLFAEITDIVERRDSQGRYLYVSRGVKRMLGYDQQELVGSNAFDIVHPDDVASARLSLRGLTTAGASTTLTYRVRHKEGHWVWLESKVRVPAISPNGYPEEITAVSRDITSRKRVEEELTTAYARAEAASATKSRFLANMSHELRTPLNAIIGFSDIIRRELFGAVGSARYKEYAQLIHESGGHLLDLINDILDMSKIEAGKLDLRFEAIDLEDLVCSSLKLLEPRASEGKLMLSAEIGNERAFVQADRRAIKQIILNLLTNAIKFTPPGGTVTVSIEALSDGAVMQVRDTGIGIAEKDLPRVTLPFEQATHDPLLAHGGSGLGLALVQSLVNLHMGTLKIDSVPGAGTCVTVFLPGDPRSRKVA